MTKTGYIVTLRHTARIVLLLLALALVFTSYPAGRAFLEIFNIHVIKTGY